MHNKYKSITDELPKKGVEVEILTECCNKNYVYRCNCKNENCNDWRCPITGSVVFVDVKKWKYL